MNTFITFIIFTILLLSLMIWTNKRFKLSGLVAFMLILIFSSNTIYLKQFILFREIRLNLTVLIMPFLYICCNYIINMYSDKDAKKTIYLTLYASFVYLVLVFMTTFINSNAVNELDRIYSVFNKNGGNSYLIFSIASMIILFISLYINYFIFKILNNKPVSKKLAAIFAAIIAIIFETSLYVYFGEGLILNIIPIEIMSKQIGVVIIIKSLVIIIANLLIEFENEFITKAFNKVEMVIMRPQNINKDEKNDEKK